MSLRRSANGLDVLRHNRGELADPRRACAAAARVGASGGVPTPATAAYGAAATGPARRAVPAAMSVTTIALLGVTRTRAAPRVDDSSGMSRLGFGV